MFSSQFNIPKQHYRVDTYPSVDDLHAYVEKASAIQGIKHCFYWVEPESEAQFTLSIHFNEKGGAPEWWMHESAEEGEKMIWFYRTEDLSVVYPQILEAVGAPNPFEEEVKEVDGTLTGKLKTDVAYATPGSTAKQKQQQEEQNKPPITKLLSGDLSITSISTILQTAQQESATGRILIKSRSGEATVQLVHGAPVHAVTPVQEGTEALLELFTWNQGSINFKTGTKPDKKTVQSPVDHILYKGAELVENISFLQEHSIDENSVVRKSNMNVSEKEFEKIVLQGPPLGLELQKSFYKNIDSNRTVQDLATFLSLSPSQWIAITANLVRLEILQSPKGTTGIIKKTEQERANHPAQDNNSKSEMPPLPGIQPNNSRNSQIPANQGITVDKHFANQATNSAASVPNNSFHEQGDTLDKKFANPATNVKKAKLPPAGAFKVGAGPSGSLTESTSPAVEAFMTSSTTVEITTTLKTGVQEEEVKFDSVKTNAVKAALTNQETGLYSLEAFQFLMEREFDRAFQTSSNLSLIVLSMKPQPGELNSSIESIRLVIGAINKIKSGMDIFGHFGEKGYAILVPGSNGQQAVSLVDKITTNLTKFAPSLASKRPTIYFGISSVPTDCTEVANLMNTAQVAMLEAAKRNVTRVQFTELK